MSNQRSIIWLLFLIVLVASAHVLVTMRYGRDVASARSEALVPEADQATLLELTHREASPIVLVRSHQWKMVAPFSASVNLASILRILDTLSFVPVSDVLTGAEMRRLGRTHADFGLDHPSLCFTIRRDRVETRVEFGSYTPGGDAVYVTTSSRPGICVVASNAFARLNLSLDDLRDPHLMEETRGLVSTIDIRRETGKFLRLTRLPSGLWQMLQPSQAPVSAQRVTALVKKIAETQSLRFVWPTQGEPTTTTPAVSLLAGYGLDAESAATISFSTPDGASQYVTFGKNADEHSVYALVQNGAAIVTIPADLRDFILAEADSVSDLKLFPYEESSVTTLSIVDEDTVYLIARTPNGEWRIDSPVSAPADQDAVRALIQTLLSLRLSERDAQGLVVSLSPNAPAVSVSRDALLAQNRLEDLRSKTILKMSSDRIRRLSVMSADGRYESVLWDETNRTWLLRKPDGAILNGLALAGVLSALDPLMANSIVRLRVAASELGNYGLENPRYIVAVDQSDEGAVRRNVIIGSPAPGGGVYATVGSTDAVVLLPEETARLLTTSFTYAE